MNVIDNFIVYRFLSLVGYLIFFLTTLISVKPDTIPVFPNPFSWFLVIFFTFCFSTLSQILEPINYEKKWLVKRFAYSSLPPLLGLILTVRFYREERKLKRDIIFEYMAIVAAIIFTLLSIFYVLILLLIYVSVSIQSLSIFFVSVGLWGFIGITIADSEIFYVSEIRINLISDSSLFVKFQTKSSLFFSWIFSSTSRRILISSILLGLMILNLLFSRNFDVNPVTV